VVDKILFQLKDVKTQEGDMLRKNSSEVKESIKKLTESATGTKPTKQVGAWTSFEVTAQSKILEAQQALRARLYKPSLQDLQRVEIAEKLTNDFALDVEAFISSDWRTYQTAVESAKLTWFKK
jgi:hypothetical protein